MKDYITYLKFDDLSEEELFECFKDDIKNHRKAVIVTPNLDGLRVSYKDAELRKYINSADYSTIDGKPLLGLAKKEKKSQFKHKISGSDMIVDLLPISNVHHWTIMIFGGKEGVAEKAKENIEKKYPNVNVVKTICPEFGFENDEHLCEKYVDEINEAHSDINLLCTGFPKTEKFYFKYQSKFNTGLYFCVGATVDFIAGNIKRAPKWMSKIGLEWLYRLMKDFRRLLKRYWLDGCFLIKIWLLITFNHRKLLQIRED